MVRRGRGSAVVGLLQCGSAVYEVKCPSCAHSESASFVRIGAVVSCAGCGQTYRVAEAHVTRRTPAGAVGAAGGGGAVGEPLTPHAPGSASGQSAGSALDITPPPPANRRAEPGVLPQQDGAPTPPNPAVTNPATAQPTHPADPIEGLSFPSSSSHTLSPRRRRQRQRRRRAAYLIAIVLGALLIALLLTLYLTDLAAAS